MCLRFCCRFHGEVLERPDGGDDSDEGDVGGIGPVATNLVHPPNVNYRARVVFPDVDEGGPGRAPLLGPGRKDPRH